MCTQCDIVIMEVTLLTYIIFVLHLLNNFSSLENALPVSRPDMEIGEKVIFLVNSPVVSMMTMLTLFTSPLLR